MDEASQRMCTLGFNEFINGINNMNLTQRTQATTNTFFVQVLCKGPLCLYLHFMLRRLGEESD